ncbi:MAG: hypothetical protein OXB93_06950 [Cytophagales bacterium]|nr:hypothetical protein [Cytophagales bacterium]
MGRTGIGRRLRRTLRSCLGFPSGLFYLGLCLVGWDILDAQSWVQHGVQDSIRVEGRFLRSETSLGTPTPYLLVVEYPLSQEVFFPDSNYHFHPFEWEGQQNMHSVLEQGRIRDSVIYELSSFETEVLQGLRIPVFLRNPTQLRDTLRIWSQPDSIRISGLLSLGGQEDLKTSMTYWETEKLFNFLYMGLGIGVGIFLLGLGIILAWKPLKRKIGLRRLKSRFDKFQQEFSREFQLMQENPQRVQHVESLLFLVKNYWETLENIPYSSMSTQEIAQKICPSGRGDSSENFLVQAFRNLDAHIYGSISSGGILKEIRLLEDRTVEKYLRQKKFMLGDKASS